jgi:CarD family transcriptional regulator
LTPDLRAPCPAMWYTSSMGKFAERWFLENGRVVYPGYGVGTVTGFETRSMNGEDRTFVILTFEDAENVSIVRIPVENVEGVGLRPVSSPEAVDQAMDFVDAGAPDIVPSWKERFALHGEMLSEGHLHSVARVLKALWILNNKKPLSFREKKMYQKALLLLASEVAEARSLPRQDAELVILDSLKKAHPCPPPR